MMADHSEPCSMLDATYCMNGGRCFKIIAMDTLTCVCSDGYKGSRCEQYQLPISEDDRLEKGLIAAVIIIVILILVVSAVIIYYIHKFNSNHTRKNSKQENNSPI